MSADNANPGNGIALPMNQVQIVNKWGAKWEQPEAKSCKSYGNRESTAACTQTWLIARFRQESTLRVSGTVRYPHSYT
jgi:hypothetical protein